MKRFFYFLLILAIGVGLFEGYRRYKGKSESVEERLAPPGIYYVIENFSVTSEHGISSLRPGRKLTLIEKGATTWRLTTGKKEFQIPPSNLTRDLDLVEKLVTANNKVKTDFDVFSKNTAEKEEKKIANRIVELEASVKSMERTKSSLSERLSLAKRSLAAAKNKETIGFSSIDRSNAEAELAQLPLKISGLEDRLARAREAIAALKAKQSIR